uniref:Uncharacterized protein n=1 Tax=Amphimedon queenslandica TaxID=400682 RepID=A0A1X7SE33_AMPQE
MAESKLERKCRRAFEKGDHKKAVRLLRSQDPKALHQKERYLLYHSISNGWLDTTRDLINNYSYPYKHNYYDGQSCLYIAAKGNHVDIVEYLIKECRCDPMMRTYNYGKGDPVLHYVARKGLLDVLKCMVMNINGHNIMNKQYRDTN